jgi:hypothetical protein
MIFFSGSTHKYKISGRASYNLSYTNYGLIVFICGSFNDDVSNSDYTASHDSMTDE